jgi:DNA ligase-associated metallophosphoesterase
MNQHAALKIAGCDVLLLADKALYWPQQQLLCIADAHFGKAAAYRALGQPVPHGTTAANLLRLDALLARYPVRELVFLGDFLHAPKSHAAATLAALHGWRVRHTNLVCKLVRGNHDLRAGDPPATLAMDVVNEPYVIGPFALRHTPGARATANASPLNAHHVIAGHIHPVFQLQGRGRQRLRLPCFHVTDDMTVLPSFGEFTGGHAVEITPSSRIFVTDGCGVWPVQSRVGRAAAHEGS